MKNMILFLVFAHLLAPITHAQITRGASPGEIYVSNFWYIDGNGNPHSAILYSPNNGEDLLLQFESFDYTIPGEMRIGAVLGDAALGALYNYCWNELWVSFDYGENWEYREDHTDYTKYFTGTNPGLIFKGTWEGFFKSTDFTLTFELLPITVTCPFTEVGFNESEFFGIYGEPGIYYNFVHSNDYGQTYTEIPIDSTVAFHQICGKYPEISRGTKLGELYLVSWWLDMNYKIFYSVDTGYTWTQQYESEYINLYFWGVQYTAGRQPGSFYVKRARYDPTFTHAQVYIDYSIDYGQTFTTYFHDLDSLYTSVPGLNKPNPSLRASPNPFSDRTSITFDLPADCKKAKLNICSLQGTLIRQFDIIGKNKQLWDGTDGDGCLVPNGVYLYNIRYNNFNSQFIKLIIIK